VPPEGVTVADPSGRLQCALTVVVVADTAVGCVIFTVVVAEHEFASLTVTVYVPKHKPVGPGIVWVFDHWYVYAGVPPPGVTVAVPLHEPKQVAGLLAEIVAVTTVG
jgi:hypothetical protein